MRVDNASSLFPVHLLNGCVLRVYTVLGTPVTATVAHTIRIVMTLVCNSPDALPARPVVMTSANAFYQHAYRIAQTMNVAETGAVDYAGLVMPAISA